MTAGPPRSASSPRIELSFLFDGLPARDETLFKAIVRLLDHRTRQRWVHAATGADIRITGAEGAKREAPDATDGAALPTLVLGDVSAQPAAHALRLPLRAHELEAALDQIGQQLLSAREAAQGGSPRHWQRHPVRLLRWPPQHLLGSRARIRLATLLVRRPMTLAEARQQAGEPEEACLAFLRDLDAAGVLEVVAAPQPSDAPLAAPATQPGKPAAGLLARIRLRLGLMPAQRA